MTMTQTRRRFLITLSLTGVAGLLRAPPSLAAEGILETTTVRLVKNPALCIAPQYIAGELLRAEGFTDVHYADVAPPATNDAVARGKVDFALDFAARIVHTIDAGQPITMIGGVMVGCYELFANEGVRSVGDLKGKRVGVGAAGSGQHLLLSVIAAHVGLDPAKDIHWIFDPSAKPDELFVDGKIDAFWTFEPESQELRARHIGHVILKTAVDRPWSQYFCCLLGANPEYVRMHPVATKRVLRAVLKAADLCATDPALAARRLVDGGFTARYDDALRTLGEYAYDKWREYDAEDTVRFYALRLHETGFIKLKPQKIIADGTDWRFLNELKRELKA